MPLMEPVLLEPFLHQVGGHWGLLRFNEGTVCKPVDPREVHFYRVMPEQLKQFCPQYRGTAKVTCEEDRFGYISVLARPTESSSKLAGPPANPNSSKFRLRKSGSIELEVSPQQLMAPESSSEAASSGEEGQPQEGGSSQRVHNPWSLRVHKRLLTRLRQDTAQEFILLENLTRCFRCPCVLDLKMGTRQHGDEVSESKKASHTQKCAETTSITLGLRICGMQVYQVTTGSFICQDKYKGRRLDTTGVSHTLSQFLNNGRELRLDLIPSILDRLRQLYSTLQSLPTFRFYSSSLLIMYDGALPDYPYDPDFSSTGEDSGASLSLEAPSTSAMMPPPSSALPCPVVDVRMIDFAHSTYEGFSRDEVVHRGPDAGYLKGLQSLLEIFQQIKDRYHPSPV